MKKRIGETMTAMKKRWPLLLPVLLGLHACSNAPTQSLSPQASDWWRIGAGEAAARSTAESLPLQEQRGKAKNVILFIGDGMGGSTVTAARILSGQLQGETGEERLLSFERFPYAGLSKTYNSNQQSPDSAGTAVAMLSGVKTRAGLLGLTEQAQRGNCDSAEGQSLLTALELAEMAGKATGIVTTSRITHATVAAAYAKTPDRRWESDASIPEQQKHCRDIARQLVEFSYGDGIDVIFGGGQQMFLPRDQYGKRRDGRNLIREWQMKNVRHQYIDDRDSLLKKLGDDGQLLGLFQRSHMNYDSEREAGEPSLSEMTRAAIARLQRHDKGFFLLVEGARIDHAHHTGNAWLALHETLALDAAVAEAVAMTDAADTLIIVTADHGSMMTMAGYPTRGNPILGQVVGNDDSGNPKTEPTLADDKMAYTTLSYADGRGMRHKNSEGGLVSAGIGRHSLDGIDTASRDFHQQALIPRFVSSHGGQDVGVYASGPGAALVTGTNEQHFIFHVMDFAAGLTTAD